MEFLVRIVVRLPADLPQDQVDTLREAELRAGRRLVADGTIQRIWRVPGTTANVGVWRTRDPEELHATLSSLPLFPWLDVDVQPLSRHPAEEHDA